MKNVRLFLALLVAVLLGACGGAPSARTPTVEPLVSRQNSGAAEEDAPAPTPARVEVLPPTLLPTLATTNSPAAPDELPDLTRQGYVTLALLRGLAETIGVLARQASASAGASPNAGASIGQRLALAALLKTLEDRLGQPPPDPALAGAWDTARATIPQLKDVLTSWNEGSLAAQDVAAKIAPIQIELDQMLAAADQRLGSSYRIDVGRFGALTGDALEQLRARLQPTPTP